MNEQLQNSSKGTTTAKGRLKEKMLMDVMILAGALKAYASVNEDAALAKDVSVTISDLKRYKETDIDDVCASILNKAKAVIKDLKDFGATKAEVDAATASINEFRDLVGKPKSAIMKIKSLNEQTAALFKASDKLLEEQMDSLMVRFKATNEVFYKEYFSARRIGIVATPKKDTVTMTPGATTSETKTVSRKKRK
jgi:hypothetical protein